MFGCKNSVIPTDGSVTSIKEGAFDACSGLTSITIPSSVTSIGNNAFSGCSGLESIIVDSGNMTYHSAGNCLIETASKMLILGCKNSIIPTDGCVTNIASRAFFDCNELVSITIPAGVESIGSYAFSGCKGLVSITIPLSVTRFDWCALSHCSNLESIKFSGTEEQWNAITKIFTWNEYTGNYTITYEYTGE